MAFAICLPASLVPELTCEGRQFIALGPDGTAARLGTLVSPHLDPNGFLTQIAVASA
jgi:hypothetical protein